MRQTVIAAAATNPFLKLPYDKKKNIIQFVQYYKNACLQRYNKISPRCPASSLIELRIRDLSAI